MEHRPRKQFGQNFLHDHNIIAKIVRAVDPQPTDCILEIGPGQGALTNEILLHVPEIHVIEIDRDLAAALPAACAASQGKLHIHNTDALNVNFSDLVGEGKPIRLVGNLPYNISTPLLFHAVDNIDNIVDMTFMLQKEVVERIVATPGHKQYGRLSVMLQYFCSARRLFDVSPHCFYPVPKVMSSVVQLKPLRERTAIANNEKLFAQLVRDSFMHRRKTLHNALKQFWSEHNLAGVTLADFGIDPMARAETLSVSDYVNLSNAINSRLQSKA